MHEFRHRAAAALRRVGADGDASDLDLRVLRRVDRLDDFPLAPRGEGAFRKIAILDVETTGTDPYRDEIIDIAVVTVEIDPAGRIVGILNAAQALRDPGMPIPPIISRITGLTDADVAGKHIDLDRLERRLMAADVRIAHNASFDIAFVERLLPGLAGAAWACSCSEVDWLDLGFDGRSLGYLLTQIGRFNTGHRAMADVVSLLHLVTQELDNGMTILGRLLERAAQPTLRVEATGAGFDKRPALKTRGYRWDPRAKVWWCEIDPADLEDEARGSPARPACGARRRRGRSPGTNGTADARDGGGAPAPSPDRLGRPVSTLREGKKLRPTRPSPRSDLMNDTTMLRHQNWMWALRREMGWPTFKPVNDCIAWASGRTMDVELGLELARLATSGRKDMVFSSWASVGAAEPVGYIVALRELLSVDIVDRCVAFAADDTAPLLLVSTRRDEHLAIGSRGLLERREGKPADLGKGRKLAVKRLRATAATMGDRLCADNRWVPTGDDWIEPTTPPTETVVRFN